jgi:hypothetical protein
MQTGGRKTYRQQEVRDRQYGQVTGQADSRHQIQKWKSDVDPDTGCMQIKKYINFVLKRYTSRFQISDRPQNPTEASTPLQKLGKNTPILSNYRKK